MNRSNTLPAALPALTLALLCLAATGARATTITLTPGHMCQSDGPVERQPWGALINLGTGSTSYQTFTCPIPRVHTGGTKLTLSLHVKLPVSNAQFLCALRSARLDGSQIHYQEFVLPVYSSTNGGEYTMTGVDLYGADGEFWMANLRCRVPNGSTKGGIVSYKVTE